MTPQFSLLAGGQYVYAKRENRVEVPTPPTFFPILFPQDEEQTYNGFNPKLGAIFGPTDALQVFANVSRNFEPVSSEFFSSSGGSDALEAQSAWTAEIGTRGRTTRFSWDLAFYHAWVKDEVLSIETPPPDSFRPTTWTRPRISASRRGFPPYFRLASRRSTMSWT